MLPGKYTAFDTKQGKVIEVRVVRDVNDKLYVHSHKKFITYKLDRFRNWKIING